MVGEIILATVGIACVLFALLRPRDEEPPAFMEGGGSHLRGERKRKR